MPAKTNIRPIDPVTDDRVTHKVAVLNGLTYHFFLGVPKDGKFKHTIFLIHGWPDLSVGWRYQIPFLIDMGFRVVVPDMIGYGGTDAPPVPPNDIRLYSYKRAADDLAELARQLGAKHIVLGGHDWGGMIVWRTSQYYPKLVTHVFSVCTPYLPPHKKYLSNEDLTNGPLPQFAYQIHLASGEVEKTVTTREQIGQFIDGVFGGTGPNGELAFTPYEGVVFKNLPLIRKGPLLSDDIREYYTTQYARNGLHGPVNWYKTRKVNWEDEQQLYGTTIDRPTLFIQALGDSVLKPEMALSMRKYLTNLTTGEVDGSHWILAEKPDECNDIIKAWIETEVLGNKSTL